MLLWMSAIVAGVHIQSNMEPVEVSFKENWETGTRNQ
jgi:hypothetical protein